MTAQYFIFAEPKNYSGPRLHFTVGSSGGKFADHGTRAPFKSLEDAQAAARWLIAHFKILRGYRLEVEGVKNYAMIGKWRMNPIGIFTLLSRADTARTLTKKNPDPYPLHRPKRKTPSYFDHQGAKLLKDFSGHAPTEVLKVKADPITKGLVIGTLDAVPYTTVRDGKTERYIHEFSKRARPLLVASSDGKRLGIVGGRFQFTEAGIVDD